MRDVLGVIASLLFLSSLGVLIVGLMRPKSVAAVVPKMTPETANPKGVLRFVGPLAAVLLAFSVVLLWMPHYKVVSNPTANVILTSTPTLTVKVKNDGFWSGTFQSGYSVDGLRQADAELPLNAQETGSIRLRLPADLSPGAHVVAVGGAKISIVALRPAAFQCTNLTCKPKVVKIGQAVTVTVNVQNTGDVAGRFPGVLLGNGRRVGAAPTGVGSGQKSLLYFTVEKKTPGKWRLRIGDAERWVMVVRPVRLPNGHVFRNNITGGSAYLEFSNNDSVDAMVLLVTSSHRRSPVMGVYVRAHQRYRITGVHDGVYGIYCCFGRDWNNYTKGFLETESRWRWRSPVAFNTTSSTRYWTTWDWWGYPISNWQTSTHWTNWTYNINRYYDHYVAKVPARKFPLL